MSKVLIVDDSATVRASMASDLAGMKFDPILAADGETAVKLFIAERPDVVLLDVNMPGIDGYETARRIRAARPEEWVPIIFLSAGEYDQNLEKAVECGGDDYLVKPVSNAVLTAKIRALQRQSHMRRKLQELTSELGAANQRLETISHEDGLTGIANRRAFDFLLGRSFSEAMRRREPLSVVLCDVDHFKAYNDHYGHLAGDECLKQIAAALKSVCKRSTDIAARYGGEEFALVLPDTPKAGALQVVEAAHREVAALAVAHSHSPTAEIVTFSAGIATYEAGRDASPQELLARADEALYRAKQLGRNRSVTA
jgi:diguanylate cyclase (GGDEF)-like protein